MDELELLVKMVGNLPQMALWVIAAFWGYKVVVVGSIYGVIRLAINKAHAAICGPRNREIRPMLDGMSIGIALEPLLEQIKRIRGVSATTKGSSYIHSSDVAWLREAIDEKQAKGK